MSLSRRGYYSWELLCLNYCAELGEIYAGHRSMNQSYIVPLLCPV